MGSCIKDPHKFWVYLKYVIFNKTHKTNKILIAKNNIIISDYNEIAKEFNDYFVMIALKIVLKVESQNFLGKLLFDNLKYNI